MAPKFACVAYQESSYGKFDKIKFCSLDQISECADGDPIKPKEEQDFDNKAKYFLKICNCVDSEGGDNDCQDINICQDYEFFRCYIIHLGGKKQNVGKYKKK